MAEEKTAKAEEKATEVERPPLAIPTAAKTKTPPKTEPLRSYRVIYDGSITHNGIEYSRGQTIELTTEEAKILLMREAIASE